MSDGSPIERLRHAGLEGALLDLLRVGEGETLRAIEASLRSVELPPARARETVDLYLAPQVQRIGLLRWEAFDHLVAIGYRHAIDSLSSEAIARLVGAAPSHRPS